MYADVDFLKSAATLGALVLFDAATVVGLALWVRSRRRRK